MRVRRSERVGDFGGAAHGFGDRQLLAAFEQRAQGLAGQKLHRDVGDPVDLAVIVHDDDIGMIQAPGRLRLALETPLKIELVLRHLIEVDGLQRDGAIEQRIDRLVDRAHRALSEFGHDDVAAELFESRLHQA